MFKIIMGLLMSFPILIGAIYIVARITKARSLSKEEKRLKEASIAAEKLQKQREEELIAENEKRWQKYEKRFTDIKNWFPEISDINDKKLKVQELKLKALKFALENDSMPLDIDEMTPEEQFAYKDAFAKKAENTLQKEIERLEKIAKDREKEREKEMEKIKEEARGRDSLEKRVRDLIETKPEDAVQVIKGWLGS